MTPKYVLTAAALLGLAPCAPAQMPGMPGMPGMTGMMKPGMCGMMGMMKPGMCCMMKHGMMSSAASSQTALQQKLTSLVQDLSARSDQEVRAALTSNIPEQRFTAALVVGQKKLPYADELIVLVRDRDPWVRQAARQGLMHLSYHIDVAKKAKQTRVQPRAVDFGPAPTATASAQKTAAQRWQRWMDQNKRHLPALAAAAAAVR